MGFVQKLDITVCKLNVNLHPVSRHESG